MSQSSISPGSDSDLTVTVVDTTQPITSQSSISPGSDSDISPQTNITVQAILSSQSSISPGSDSDEINYEAFFTLYPDHCRNPVSRLEVILTRTSNDLAILGDSNCRNPVSRLEVILTYIRV